ncbi:MAG: PEP-CTERM sorting domain-containing protein [Planctomycetaceae bacterium]|nr:MAG: PEP-CTERM sorting domain-containing protein [Planctomycetaceae bacterium]
MLKLRSLMVAMVVCTASACWADGIDWESLPYTSISSYEAVTAAGGSAYTGGFPVRMIGVVLNNTEDWLNPTANNFFAPYTFQMGGQSELIIQAVATGDFGGVFCWMGQNYGNTYRADPDYSYSNAEWTAELGRLGLYGGDGVTNPIRAGTLVEIRARIGLNYGGKMNVNEAHNNDPANDFEIIILDRNYGLPTATELSLSDLKHADDTFIFDATRQTGGERYQASRVELKDVWITSACGWTSDTDITVTDGLRTFNVYLGLNSSFNGTELFAAGEHFNVTGILDQASSNGMGGYQLLAMNASDFAPVPEPATLTLLAIGGLAVIRKRRTA